MASDWYEKIKAILDRNSLLTCKDRNITQNYLKFKLANRRHQSSKVYPFLKGDCSTRKLITNRKMSGLRTRTLL